MNLRTKALLIVLLTLTAFAVGRHSAQSSAPNVKDVETVKTDSDTKTNKETHKTTTITKKPNGEETTTITEDTVTSADRKRDSVTRSDQTTTQPKLSPLNLSALVGVEPTSNFKVVYGVSITKQVLGPVTVGVWGLTNSSAGVSLGLNF